jgi:hypothetical protein
MLGHAKRFPQQQERDVIAGCATTVFEQYGYAHFTIWRWTTTDKNTQLKNII